MDVQVGDEFYVYIDKTNPDIGLMDFEAPFDEEAMINSINELNVGVEHFETKLIDTVIKGDSVQLLIYWKRIQSELKKFIIENASVFQKRMQTHRLLSQSRFLVLALFAWR